MAVPSFKGGGIANGTADQYGGMRDHAQKEGLGATSSGARKRSKRKRRKPPLNLKGLRRGKAG